MDHHSQDWITLDRRIQRLESQNRYARIVNFSFLLMIFIGVGFLNSVSGHQDTSEIRAKTFILEGKNGTEMGRWEVSKAFDRGNWQYFPLFQLRSGDGFVKFTASERGANIDIQGDQTSVGLGRRFRIGSNENRTHISFQDESYGGSYKEKMVIQSVRNQGARLKLTSYDLEKNEPTELILEANNNHSGKLLILDSKYKNNVQIGLKPNGAPFFDMERP